MSDIYAAVDKALRTELQRQYDASTVGGIEWFDANPAYRAGEVKIDGFIDMTKLVGVVVEAVFAPRSLEGGPRPWTSTMGQDPAGDLAERLHNDSPMGGSGGGKIDGGNQIVRLVPNAQGGFDRVPVDPIVFPPGGVFKISIGGVGGGIPGSSFMRDEPDAFPDPADAFYGSEFGKVFRAMDRWPEDPRAPYVFSHEMDDDDSEEDDTGEMPGNPFRHGSGSIELNLSGAERGEEHIVPLENGYVTKSFPITMLPVREVIYCPNPACREQHIDRDEWATTLHKSHKCEHCGLTWRHSDVPTVGVEDIVSEGQRDDLTGNDRARVDEVVRCVPPLGMEVAQYLGACGGRCAVKDRPHGSRRYSLVYIEAGRRYVIHGNQRRYIREFEATYAGQRLVFLRAVLENAN